MTIIKKDTLEQFSKVSIRCLKFYFKFLFFKYNFILRLRLIKTNLAVFKIICKGLLLIFKKYKNYVYTLKNILQAAQNLF